MGKDRTVEIRWPRWTERQAKFAPIGVPITTYLLVYFDKAEWEIWQIWRVLDDLGAVSNMVSLGVAVYIVAMIAIDWSIKMVLGGLTRAKQRRVAQRLESAMSVIDDPNASREEIRKAVEEAKKEMERPNRDGFVIRWLESWDD